MADDAQITGQSINLTAAIQFGMVQITWRGYTTSCDEYGFLWWRRWKVVAWRAGERYEARHKSPLEALERVWQMLPAKGDMTT